DGSFGAVRRICAEQLEQARFVAAVLFDAAVEVEVFVGDVGEQRYVEGAAIEAPPAGRQRVRGGFDHGVVAACGDHIAQQCLDFVRFGGAFAAFVGPLALRDFEMIGVDHSGGVAARFEYGAGEEGGGGFAVGVGDADDAHGLVWVFVEGGGQRCEGDAAVL